MKIAIIGSKGSGKSYILRKIAEQLGFKEKELDNNGNWNGKYVERYKKLKNIGNIESSTKEANFLYTGIL